MTKKDVESMNEYKHSDELKKLIVRLGSNRLVITLRK